MADEDSRSPTWSPPVRERAPYEPPVVEDSAAFETLALSCGKSDDEPKCIFEGTISAS